jgi:hypothetical protein
MINHYTQQLRILGGTYFSSGWGQLMTAKEICIELEIFMLLGTIPKSSLRLHLSRNQLVVMPTFASVISLDKFKSICRFMHFTDNYSGHI